VKDWLGEQTPALRAAIEIVVIDPSAPYASGIRAALPNALIAVDKWHLVALANQMVTEVRQRVTRDLLGRRGTVADPVWLNRRILLTGADHLSAKQWKRLAAMLDHCDPTQEIGAAWGVRSGMIVDIGQSKQSDRLPNQPDTHQSPFCCQNPLRAQLWSTEGQQTSPVAPESLGWVGVCTLAGEAGRNTTEIRASAWRFLAFCPGLWKTL
jgi:Transposase